LFTRIDHHARASRDQSVREIFCLQHKVIIVFQIQKGLLPSIVQAGLLVAACALLSACGKQPAPVDSSPARVAVASAPASVKTDSADVPEIVVTASRPPEG
jgi:hypothetical protein